MVSLTPCQDAQAAAVIEAKRQIAALPDDDPDKRRWQLALALMEPLQMWVAEGRDNRACVAGTLGELCSSVAEALSGVVGMFEKNPERKSAMGETLLRAIETGLEDALATEPAIAVKVKPARHQHRAGRA